MPWWRAANSKSPTSAAMVGPYVTTGSASDASPASSQPAIPLDAGNTQQNCRSGWLWSGYSYAVTCNAFVLGGGGVLGAAEVGMARALLEAGVRPDLVCGTSVGAINGAALAADPTPDGVKRLLAIWDALADDGVLDSSLIRRVAEVMRRRTSLHGNDTLRRLLRDRLPAQRFEDLAVPFECVAASIERAREHWFSTRRPDRTDSGVVRAAGGVSSRADR